MRAIAKYYALCMVMCMLSTVSIGLFLGESATYEQLLQYALMQWPVIGLTMVLCWSVRWIATKLY